MSDIEYRISPPLGDTILNRLYTEVWPEHQERAFERVLARSVTYIGAFDDDDEVLVGFVYVAWDGAAHAFLLEPSVLPRYRGRGVGSELIRLAAREAADAGAEWLHVDYAAELEPFYAAAGFRPSRAGVLRLRRSDAP